MITLNTLHRKHKDEVNIAEGYALGYSYITRRSKLSALLEIATVLGILRNLFYYSFFRGSGSYLRNIPYFLLLRDLITIIDNWYTIMGCVDDRRNELYSNLADGVTWIVYWGLGAYFPYNLSFFTGTLALRLAVDAGILIRYIMILYETSKDTFYQSTGQGIVWSSFYMLFWMWLTERIKAPFYVVLSPLIGYVGFILLSSVIIFIRIINMNNMKLERYYVVVLLELSVYMLLLYSLYFAYNFVEGKTYDNITAGFICLFLAFIYFLFYLAVLTAGKIEQIGDAVEEEVEEREELLYNEAKKRLGKKKKKKSRGGREGKRSQRMKESIHDI